MIPHGGEDGKVPHSSCSPCFPPLSYKEEKCVMIGLIETGKSEAMATMLISPDYGWTLSKEANAASSPLRVTPGDWGPNREVVGIGPHDRQKSPEELHEMCS